MARKKKLLTSAIALGTAAALTLGGTFAWQSINQTALNESSDDVNPGGRLHDDFDGVNKDVYVENFADENIFARIRLTEYFEVVMNYGNEEAETVDTVIGERGAEVTNGDGSKDVERTGTVFKFDGRVSKAENGVITVNAGKDPAVTDSDYYWWTWTMGSEKSDTGYYMPTFNMNKDSLVADVNGKYKTPGVITSQNIGQYTDYHAYAKNETEAGTEIFDADRNQVDEVGSDFSADNLEECVTAGNITLYNKLGEDGEPTYAEDGTGITHTAKEIGNSNGLISMAEWLALNGGVYSADTHGGYWVYDTDGWVYWSSPIAPDSTTGRLLDGIQMNHVMDDSWYYKLTVEGEFVTADDLGKDNGTGFYADEAPTKSAETLLAYITNTEKDWSQFVTMRNITSDEWDTLVQVTNGGADDIIHWYEMGTLTDTVAWSDRNVVRGHDSAEDSFGEGVMYCGVYFGFRPTFEAAIEDCVGLTPGDNVLMGTLYKADSPVKVPLNPTNPDPKDGVPGSDLTEYDTSEKGNEETSKITLGKALDDHAYRMRAIYIGDGKFVCDRVMLCHLSWNQLTAALS